MHIVVPYVPGGGVDAFGRVLAGKLQDRLGVTVIVDNRGGAGGNVGGNFVAKSAPDGYTILAAASGEVANAMNARAASGALEMVSTPMPKWPYSVSSAGSGPT